MRGLILRKGSRSLRVYERNVSRHMKHNENLVSYKEAIEVENDRLQALLDSGDISQNDVVSLLENFAMTKKLEMFPEERQLARRQKIAGPLSVFKPFAGRAIITGAVLAVQGIMLLFGSPSLLVFGLLALVNILTGIALASDKELSSNVKTGGLILIVAELIVFSILGISAIWPF